MPSSAILTKLDRIHKHILKKYDSALYERLTLLDIAPSIYGLRWIRVLFAREFTFAQTFRVWDAIFADNMNLDLLDYVFVAMLCHHRQPILMKDSMDCMRLLMSQYTKHYNAPLVFLLFSKWCPKSRFEICFAPSTFMWLGAKHVSNPGFKN